MSEQPGDRVQSLFDQAVVLPPEERAAFLESACTGDPELRAEVECLLACDANFARETGEGLLKSPLVRLPELQAGAGSEQAGWPAGPRVQVRHYRIVRRIAEGGMGAVYEAEQDQPRRPVALKVVRPGLASPALLKRFTHEAQILGRLHHPGIAQVYEAGLADDGQPFFAMEFIRGLPLDEYANRHGLDLAARVNLLARVCDAVQHAHDHGIIHRDLKPANILVDETGQPKVLDFGVARATDVDALTVAGLTQTGQLLGTPNYMSPEQITANAETIDQRVDVYALGVILFELAAHRLPFHLDNRPLAEAARVIVEQDPPRLGSLDPELRGDVETIVAKALEKDPARRYAAAAALAADLRRWLAHEPILARPPSVLYHLRKFARRHKALVAGSVATVLALVLGLIGTIFFAVRESHQRGQAEHNAQMALDEKQEALFQAYRARMAAAVAALSAHDVADAARQLETASQDLRDWEWRHLRSRLDDSSAVISLPAGSIGFLLDAPLTLRSSPSAGGRREGEGGAPDRFCGAAWMSSSVRLIDLETGAHTTVPIGPERRAVSLNPTRHGLRIVAWVGKAAFEVLDEAGHVVCHVARPDTDVPLPVVVSPDGKWLVAPRVDGAWVRLVIYDATSGKQTAVCAGHREDIWHFTFSPDGTRLTSASEDRTACVWDTASGALLATCGGHTSKVLGVSFSPDGARLVTAAADGTVRQWDARTGRAVEAPYDRHAGEVHTAVYSPDGQWVASAGIDRTIRVWRATGRQDVAILHGHTGGVVALAFAPDGRRLASLSRNSRLVASGDGTVRIWEVDPQATLPVLRGHTRFVYPVAFSPDGRWLASGSWDKTVRLWDAATGEACAILRHPGVVPCLAYSPDGTWLVSGNHGDNRLRMWDTATGAVRKEIQGPGGLVHALTISADGKRVTATANENFKDHWWVCDITSGERLFSGKGEALAYSPDGGWLAVRDPDEKTLLLLDARTYETAAHFHGHERIIWSATFSPDSRRLASCSQDHTVRVWQIDNDAPPPSSAGVAGRGKGEEGPRAACRVLRGPTDEIFTAAFHPDCRRLATAGRDGVVWLWDPVRGEEVARLQGHKSYIWSVAFSPDGTTLASGSGDFTVRLWDTAPLKDRYQARRQALPLQPEAERLVERLLAEKKNAADVGAALRADRSLTEPQRHAALRTLLRRSAR